MRRGRRRPGACAHVGPVHALTYARLFPNGWWCALHTPRALRGLPELPPGPGWPEGAYTTPSPLSDSRVHDARAIASGKRRSSPAAYRAAQADLYHRSELNL
ncbi:MULTISPECIES: hypothetical protein [Streptomyces]